MSTHDSFGLSSNGSQASEIMAQALTRKPKQSAQVYLHNHNGVAEDFAADDRAESGNAQAPNYHYFGLAPSQSQTQSNGEAIEESSQKENLGAGLSGDLAQATEMRAVAHARAASARPTVQKSPAKPARGDAQKVEFIKPRAAASNITVGCRSSRATPTASTQLGPLKTPSKPRHSTFPQVDQFSQDSFAGGLDFDPGQRYIATSNKFSIPVSQLAENQDDTMGLSTSYSVSYRATLQGAHAPEGRILVESTPSNSEASHSSQEVSQELELAHESEPEVVQEQPQCQDSGDSQPSQDSAPTSSYRRYVNGESDLERDVDPSTQPGLTAGNDDSVATQPNSPIDTSQATSAFQPSAPLSLPKSARGLLNANKPWRYAAYVARREAADAIVNPTASSPVATGPAIAGTTLFQGENTKQPFEDADPPSHDPPQVATGPDPCQETLPGSQETQPFYDEIQLSDMGIPQRVNLGPQETQPSNDDEEWAPQLRRVFPSRAAPQALDPVYDNSLRSTHDASDHMDIVPDSEALRSEVPKAANTSPSVERSMASARVLRNRSPNSDSVDDIVPDSLMENGFECKNRLPDQHVLRSPLNFRSPSRPGHVTEDEEDDVPLAAASVKRRKISETDKAKAKALDPVMAPPPVPERAIRVTATKNARHKEKQKATIPKEATTLTNQRTSRSTRSDFNRSWEINEVPSSAPEQDGPPQPKVTPKSLSTKPSMAIGSSSTKRVSKAVTKVVKKRRVSSDSEESELSEIDDELLMVKVEGEDSKTDPVGDDDHSDDEESTRKRKRTARAPVPKTSSKKPKPKRKSTSPPAGSLRQTKRLRSITSTSTRIISTEPTRVFALWRLDGYYYPGIIHSVGQNGLYRINFDDTTNSDVSLDQIRIAELRVDDEVVLDGSTRSIKVVDVAQLDDDKVTVWKKGQRVDVELHRLKLSNKTAEFDWKDRVPDAQRIVPEVQFITTSPSPSKASIVSGVSNRATQGALFDGTGFVVTMSAANNNFQKDKARVHKYIQNHGGTVIDDWASVINLDGTHTKSPRRWVIAQKDIAWRGKDLERVFLLSDDPNTKPKYLIALALGVPCIDTQWLELSVNENAEKEWHAFLLSQGFSDALGGRVSQMIDLDWGTSSLFLTQIASNKVPPKVFTGCNILCIGEDLMPPSTSRGSKNKSEEPGSRSVPHIIACMGAKRVEAVTKYRNASMRVQEFDYVIIKDEDKYTQDLEGATIGDVGWIKQCLVAGRMLPLPNWNRQEEEEES